MPRFSTADSNHDPDARPLSFPYRTSAYTEKWDMLEYIINPDSSHPSDWQMLPHRHVQHEIALVRRGGCTIHLGEETHWLNAGIAFFLPSGVSHGFTACKVRGVDFSVVHFGRLAKDLAALLINRQLLGLGLFNLTELEQKRFQHTCQQLQRELNGSLPHAEVQCQALINQLVVMLLRNAARKQTPGLNLEQEQVVESALRHMHDYASETVLIEEIAGKVGLSPAHFRKLFRQHVGVSPKRYLTALRLEAGKCLLMQRDRSIAEVALLSGFSTPQHFSKVFHQCIGITPSQWRDAYALPDGLDPAGETSPMARIRPILA